MGICPSHVHEVALGCLANTTKVSRYNYVEVVRLSAEQISLVRVCNKQKREASNLMPAYSPNIQYGCVSRTHFVFAHKLGKDATPTLYNNNEVHIRWRADDPE